MNEIQIISKSSIEDKNFQLRLDKNFTLSAYCTKNISQELSFKEGSIYLYVQEGSVSLEDSNSSFKVGAGNYLSRKCPITLTLSKESYVLIVETPSHFNSLNHIGGPIEETGRLNYIDGCSDTLLIPPVKLGEPCLNFLHFPKNTLQTMHNHPSFRYGIITKGNGHSLSETSKHQLSTGDIFLIPSFFNHKFDTTEDIMDVIAFHPDSDWGPTDEIHPMINRTWVNGKKI